MYQYTAYDLQVVTARAQQFRDQLARWQSGELSDEHFKPLRLQNGWYVQRFAPMLRVAVPYGAISAAQLRALAGIARTHDRKSAHPLQQANPGLCQVDSLPDHCAHFTTRQNVQFNWIPLSEAADVMDTLAQANMHGIQTSGNCVRNITCDALAGLAQDECADPRPLCELIRQWSVQHPEFAYLPRKFKVAVSAGADDRAVTDWHDVGLRLQRLANGELVVRVAAGGGMGRTPLVATVIREHLPWTQTLNYLEAVLRVYNLWGRRDNLYKARLKILVRAETQRFIQEVENEFARVSESDAAACTLTQTDWDEVATRFAPAPTASAADVQLWQTWASGAPAATHPGYARWLRHHVVRQAQPGLAAVTLDFKRVGQGPGDATADQLQASADLAERFGAAEARITHRQNLLLPHVPMSQLPALWQAARQLGLAQGMAGGVTDIIACPGGDFCSLANARSLPLAQALLARYQDLDEIHDLGPLAIHISGCMNSCGHHHSGHIGVLGVDKDGQEWYQITLGGSDGRLAHGPAAAGKVLGPAFAAQDAPAALQAVLDAYLAHRQTNETFLQTLQRIGVAPFRQATDAARQPNSAAS